MRLSVARLRPPVLTSSLASCRQLHLKPARAFLFPSPPLFDCVALLSPVSTSPSSSIISLPASKTSNGESSAPRCAALRKWHAPRKTLLHLERNDCDIITTFPRGCSRYFSIRRTTNTASPNTTLLPSQPASRPLHAFSGTSQSSLSGSTRGGVGKAGWV